MQKLRRQIIFSVIPGTFLSFLMVLSTKYLLEIFNDASPEYTPPDFAFVLILAVILSSLFFGLFSLNFKQKPAKNFKTSRIKSRLKIFLPLSLVSIISLLAFFPGHFPFDASVMRDSFSSGNLTTHYSPLVSAIIGLTFSLGEKIGNVNLAHFFLILLQIIFTNFALTETIFYCEKKLQKKSFAYLFTIFFALHPLVQSLLIRTGQDTIFGALFLLLLLEVLKISENENYFHKNKIKKFIYLFFVAFFFFATRNNGIYAALPLFLAAFFCTKNKSLRKNFLIALLLPFVIFLSANELAIKNIVASKDSFFRETLNVPVVQIARAVYQNDDKDFKNELETYFKQDCEIWLGEKWSFEKYNKSAGISDPYKDCLNLAKIDENPLKFFDLWRRIGEKYPLSFLEAPIVFTSPLYHPYINYESNLSTLMWHTYVDCFYHDYSRYGLENHSLLPRLNDFMYFLVAEQNWSKVPILHLLWGAPFTIFSLFFAILLALYHKKRHFLLPLSFIFGLVLTVALSPVMLFRYLLPAVLAAPIIFYIIHQTIHQETTGKTSKKVV